MGCRKLANGGPIALVKNGDIITIDANNGILQIELDDKELEKRKKEWEPRETNYQTGALWKYSQEVSDAEKGAVTHPGAKFEKHIYADL